jgi:hypothetical protein
MLTSEVQKLADLNLTGALNKRANDKLLHFHKPTSTSMRRRRVTGALPQHSRHKPHEAAGVLQRHAGDLPERAPSRPPHHPQVGRHFRATPQDTPAPQGAPSSQHFRGEDLLETAGRQGCIGSAKQAGGISNDNRSVSHLISRRLLRVRLSSSPCAPWVHQPP